MSADPVLLTLAVLAVALTAGLGLSQLWLAAFGEGSLS